MAPTATDELIFRSNIRLWLWTSFALALSGPVLYTVILFTSPHNAGKPFILGDLLSALAVTSACGAGIAAIAIATRRFQVVKVFPAGLQGFDMYGRNHFTTWNDIQNVRRVNLSGHPFLYIRVPFEANSITLPLFLEDMPKFIDAVEGYAGRDNALVKELRGT